MPRRPFNVLFLCTGNSARSILAEAYPNATGACLRLQRRRLPEELQGASLWAQKLGYKNVYWFRGGFPE